MQTVDWTNGGTGYEENVQALCDAIEKAQAGHRPAQLHRAPHDHRLAGPDAQNTGKAHGSALGADEVAATKKVLGFDPDADLRGRRRGHRAHPRGSSSAASRPRPSGRSSSTPGRAQAGSRKALFDRMQTRTLPAGWDDALPTFDADAKGIATRAASGEVLNAIAPELPELWGGSADLAESNNTTTEGRAVVPARRSTSTKKFSGDPYGRVLHFGIREHAHGRDHERHRRCTAAPGSYGGTFLTFSDYMRGSVRLAALMQLPVTYVWTHDSIGLGEDGPTHQPIEHLAALRAIPGLDVVRPADANETAAAGRRSWSTPTARPGWS